jgi:hypothetical protein
LFGQKGILARLAVMISDSIAEPISFDRFALRRHAARSAGVFVAAMIQSVFVVRVSTTVDGFRCG